MGQSSGTTPEPALPWGHWPLSVRNKMAGCLRIVAVACGVALLASGCGGASPSSLDYRGTTNGVVITLHVPSKKAEQVGAQPELAVRFTTASGTAWRRVLHARKEEAFCLWPEKTGGREMSTTDVQVRSKHLALAVPGSVSASTGAYTCGLHARTGGGSGSFSAYVRAALVAAPLRQAHN